jgi:methionyl-tRNA formyltransferase
MPVRDRGEPGEVLTDDLVIGTGDDAIKLLKVQRPGKGVMDAREMLKGFALPPGTLLV